MEGGLLRVLCVRGDGVKMNQNINISTHFYAHTETNARTLAILLLLRDIRARVYARVFVRLGLLAALRAAVVGFAATRRRFWGVRKRTTHLGTLGARGGDSVATDFARSRSFFGDVARIALFTR